MGGGPPRVVALDVNGTLSDMAPLGRRFADAGAPEHLAETWFAATLRDGFALSAAETPAPFREVALATARTLLAAEGASPAPEGAAEHVVEGLESLGVHPDVPDGLRALAASGVRLVTLTNGAAASSQRLLADAGLDGLVDLHLSVEDAGRWKPDARAYAYAARRCDVAPDAMALIAAHLWDVHGAQGVGMSAGWIDRSGAGETGAFRPPQARGATLLAVGSALVEGGRTASG